MLDLDGTLIQRGQIVSQEVAEILTELSRQRRVLINSARHPAGIKHALDRFFCFIPTISLNGAGLHLSSWSEFSEFITFDTVVLQKLYEKLSQAETVTSYYGRDFWAVSCFNDYVSEESRVTGMTPKMWNPNRMADVMKVCLMGDDSVVRHLLQEIKNDRLNINMMQSNPGYVEITPESVTKASYIERFLVSEGLSRTSVKIVFLGDSDNDIPCAEYSNEAYTFAGASTALLQVCTGKLPERSCRVVAEFLEGMIDRKRIDL